jgi:transposase
MYDYTDPKDASIHLFEWGMNAILSGIEEFKQLALSFFRKKYMIIDWFKNRKSSAISEGFNNKIKRLKRMAYGYRDVDYFLLKIHQHCGRLNPRIAH